MHLFTQLVYISVSVWSSHLAAMKAPKIIVNTVILMDVEYVVL